MCARQSNKAEMEGLRLEKSGRVATITINRPERLNALSSAVQNGLTTLLDRFEKDDEVGCVIITGAPRPDGRPCFSAGADIKEMQEKGTTFAEGALGTLEEGLRSTLASLGKSGDMAWYSCFNKLYDFSKPTIAAIDGICTAGGLELAMCCDIRVVAETAEIRDLHMRNVGTLGSGGLQTLLPRLVNVGKAKQLIWTGDAINGKQAYELGFAQEVFPPDKMLAGAMSLAIKIAAMPVLALRMSKLAINSGLDKGAYDSFRFTAFLDALMRQMTSETQARMREAFLRRKAG